MSGLGAWSFGYYHEGMNVPNDRVAAGVKAFKQALIDNGFSTGINLDARGFGHSAGKQAKAFQKANWLTVDGVIGPLTAKYLFRHYSFYEEGTSTIEIPNHFVQKLGGLESGHDPVAQGWADEKDEGWAQLHMPYFPNLTLAQAWTPSIAINKVAHHMKLFYMNSAPDWEGAVASWNVGSGTAQSWVMAGKPSSDPSAEGGIDWYARAYHYVSLVKAQGY